MTDGGVRLAFSPLWEVEVVDGEGSGAFGPQRSLIFHGTVFPYLYDAVGRSRPLDEIEASLGEVAHEAAARDALGRLWRSGVLVRAPEGYGSRQEEARLTYDPGPLPSVRVAGDVDAPADWRRLLEAAGLTCSDSPDVTVVLTLDYLSVSTLLASLEVEGDVLLARPVGPAAWIGPLLRPGHPPCVACLEERLLLGRPLLAGLRQLPAWRPTGSHRALRPDADAAVLVRHLRRLLASGSHGDGASLQGSIARVPLDGRPPTVHPVPPRPQCPECGDPGLLRERRERPPLLRSTPVRASSTAGLRTETAKHLAAPHTVHVGGPEGEPALQLAFVPPEHRLHDVTVGEGSRLGARGARGVGAHGGAVGVRAGRRLGLRGSVCIIGETVARAQGAERRGGAGGPRRRGRPHVTLIP